MNIKPMTLLMTVAIVNGCTPYAESFDCPPGRGVGCKSLNIVNHMVEEGQLPLENAPFESESLKSEPLETESPKTLSDQGKEEDKKVEIRSKKLSNKVVLEVHDNGIGISKRNQKRIFDKFYRVTHGNLAHQAKGAGLGLNIVKNNMKAFNGKVGVNSEPGVGSCFSLIFPQPTHKQV